MTEHTPTPWSVDPDMRPGMKWNNHIVAGDKTICFMAHSADNSECEANAEFIVKACNGHEALVAALEHIVSGDEIEGACDCNSADIARAALEAAR